MKVALGLLLALIIGIAWRKTGVPLPAPPVFIGGLLVLAMTLGYVTADRFATHRKASTRPLCGGPTGQTGERQHG